MAQTRNGKAVMNLGSKSRSIVCWPLSAQDDHIAVIGENRKILLFPLADLPEMARGKGVMLQKYKDGKLSDAKTFNVSEGLTWQTGRGVTTETDLIAYMGKRAQAGRMAPHGFPRKNKFS